MHATPFLPPAAGLDRVAMAARRDRSPAGIAAWGDGAVGRYPASGRAGPMSGRPSPQDVDFIALQNALRPHGGLSRLSHLAAGTSQQVDGRACDAGQLVEAGALFGFHWHDALWIPLFQFDRPGQRLATGLRQVVDELGRDADGWALARWFVQPNSRLAGRCPVECMTADLPAVLAAARADRFIAAG